MNRWRLLVNAYFTFTRREQSAALLLAGLILLFQSILLGLHYLPDPPVFEPDSALLAKMFQWQQLADTFERKQDAYPVRLGDYHKNLKSETKTEMIPFNPDTMKQADWIAVGLSEKQTEAVLRFIGRKGHIPNKETFQQIYVISPQRYQQLEPYLRFSNAAVGTNSPIKKETAESPKAVRRVDVNTADSTELMQLPMIGVGRARAIIRYREKLGGFVALDQLKEVYLLPDSVLKTILPYLSISTQSVRKIDINLATKEGLRHPYIGSPLAALIVQYRQAHGPYKRLEDLLQLPLLNEESFRKIAPYLTLSQ